MARWTTQARVELKAALEEMRVAMRDHSPTYPHMTQHELEAMASLEMKIAALRREAVSPLSGTAA